MAGKTLFAKEIILNRTGSAVTPSSNGLTTDGLSNLYINGVLVGGGGAETLGDLTDVEVSTAVNGQVLMYISASSMDGTTSSNVLSSLALDSSTIVDPDPGLNNGSITVVPTGGTPGYTYSWSDGQNTSAATNLVAGAYTCTVIDNIGDTLAINFTLAGRIRVRPSGRTSQ